MNIMINMMVLVLAAIIAWGRFGPYADLSPLSLMCSTPRNSGGFTRSVGVVKAVLRFVRTT